MRIAYKSGFKYQLAENFDILTSIKGYNISTYYITLSPIGKLSIKKGYAWDGASGPTIDTKTSMRGSLVHDALYQMIRMNELPLNLRGAADEIFYEICIEDGMWRWRAWLWLTAVKLFARNSALPINERDKQYA